LFLFFFSTTLFLTLIFTLSLHDALPIYSYGLSRFPKQQVEITYLSRQESIYIGSFQKSWFSRRKKISYRRRTLRRSCNFRNAYRSEEHTSELQSRSDLVCRLLLEKKKKK